MVIRILLSSWTAVPRVEEKLQTRMMVVHPLMLGKRCDPISEMLRSYKPDEHTKDAIDWLEDDDCNYQEKAAEWFWDAITERVKAEYAFAIFKRRHIFGEAA